MTLELQRLTQDPQATVGEISIWGVHECWSLEPAPASLAPDLDHPCIPAGSYKVDILFSPHFRRMVPHVLNVPGRSEIEIHSGNTPDDTHGCILVGQTKRGDSIQSSILALAALQSKIAGELAKSHDVFLEIFDVVGGAV